MRPLYGKARLIDPPAGAPDDGDPHLGGRDAGMVQTEEFFALSDRDRALLDHGGAVRVRRAGGGFSIDVASAEEVKRPLI
jgi:hypothetical protein